MTDLVVTINADTTIAATDRVVLVDSTAAPVAVTLPPPTSGERHSLKDYGATGLGYSATNPVTVDPNGVNIDGVAGPYLLANNEGLNLVGTGTDWSVIV